MSSEVQEQFPQIISVAEEVRSASPETPEEVEQFRIKYLGSKGIMKSLMGEIKEIAPDQKRFYGQAVNQLKQEVEARFEELKKTASAKQKDEAKQSIDLSLPPENRTLGSRHPLSIVRNRIVGIFAKLGYTVAEGPEIEDDWHNFTALNTPPDHPARDMQDTFYIQQDPVVLARTHTSSVQIRVMEQQDPPIRIVCPGRVFRNETISARAHCTFHQVEGLYINENVSFADLKQTLLLFTQEMFGSDTKIRLRPSYFPFTEPSAEVDVSCFICKQKGCSVCKKTGWVEVMGCGMVDPEVLKNCNIDPEKYSGFAFGMGIERIAMLKYEIEDIRVFWENDIRFLKQFRSAF